MGRAPAIAALGFAAAASIVFAASASAEITIGSTLTSSPTAGFSTPSITLTQTVPQDRSFVSPVDGELVRWRWLNPLGASARARVLRSVDGGATFTGAGTGPTSTSPAGGPVVFPLGPVFPIRKGDYFGVDQLSAFAVSLSTAVSPGTSVADWVPALPDGAFPIAPSASGNEELLVNADVEPEVTTITVQPRVKVRTEKKRVHAPFSFTSNQSGLGFECSLDGAPFSPCRAPIDYFVKPGAHNFQVEATLEGKKFGNTPSVDFKVKKRKKRKKH
jgi:hypothetical protein